MARAKSSSHLPTLAAMLCASTAMAIAQQFLVSLRATHKSTLSVSFTMYAADAALTSLTGGGAASKRPLAPRLRLAAGSVPALDIAGCLLAYFALERLGAGPFTLYFSSILALSAVLSFLSLGKRLSSGQTAGIALVSGGLVLRSLLADASALGDDAGGIILTLASTAAYATRTVVMEWLRTQPAAPSAAELSAAIGRWGFTVLGAWQLAYTLPRWSALVARPSAAAGVTLARALVTHGAYAASRCLFVLSQNAVISSAGATGVALVTAVRSVVVALISAALFCGTTPSQCLTRTQAGCAGLVVAGGIIYALAPPPPQLAARGKRD